MPSGRGEEAFQAAGILLSRLCEHVDRLRTEPDRIPRLTTSEIKTVDRQRVFVAIHIDRIFSKLLSPFEMGLGLGERASLVGFGSCPGNSADQEDRDSKHAASPSIHGPSNRTVAVPLLAQGFLPQPASALHVAAPAPKSYRQHTPATLATADMTPQNRPIRKLFHAEQFAENTPPD
jgi:hypothetical protein